MADDALRPCEECGTLPGPWKLVAPKTWNAYYRCPKGRVCVDLRATVRFGADPETRAALLSELSAP